MCGIVGAVSTGDIAPYLLDGLRRLEYRGYDSAGIAVVDGDGKLSECACPDIDNDELIATQNIEISVGGAFNLVQS